MAWYDFLGSWGLKPESPTAPIITQKAEDAFQTRDTLRWSPSPVTSSPSISPTFKSSTSSLGFVPTAPALTTSTAPTMQPPADQIADDSNLDITQPSSYGADGLSSKSSQLPPAPSTLDINAWVASLAQLNIPQSPEETRLEGDRETMMQGLETDQEALEGEPQRRQELLGQYGFSPENVKRAQDLSVLIAQKSAQYQQQYFSLEGQGNLSPFVQGAQARLQRSSALDIGVLSAERAAIMGNLDLARSLTDELVKLEFDPIRQKIDNTLKFLELNSASLGREDKKRAEKTS